MKSNPTPELGFQTTGSVDALAGSEVFVSLTSRVGALAHHPSFPGSQRSSVPASQLPSLPGSQRPRPPPGLCRRSRDSNPFTSRHKPL